MGAVAFAKTMLRHVQVGICRALGVVLGRLGVRFVVVPSRFIGHLASEPDFWVKERLLGRKPRTRDVLLASRATVANRALLRYWARYFRVVDHPLGCRALESLATHGGLKVDPFEYQRNLDPDRQTYGPISSHAILREWGDRPPLLSLAEEDRRRGRAVLERLGVPADAWFVCVHNREPTFYHQFEAEWPREAGRPLYPSGFRDCAIENYRLAIDAIVERGGWVVRMGDATTRPLPPLDHVIDYAHLDVRCDAMDLFLCASCRFFLGNSSGLFYLSSVFGVPVARANAVPFATLWGYPGDLIIPKLMWSRPLGRYLTFAEVFGSPVADYHYHAPFDAAGIIAEENGPEDVLGLAREMLERLEGKVVYDVEDERLQRRIRGLFRSHHYCHETVARVGRDFLRRYENLIDPREDARMRGSSSPADGTIEKDHVCR